MRPVFEFPVAWLVVWKESTSTVTGQHSANIGQTGRSTSASSNVRREGSQAETRDMFDGNCLRDWYVVLKIPASDREKFLSLSVSNFERRISSPYRIHLRRLALPRSMNQPRKMDMQD